MVKIRATAIASVVLLLSTSLSASLGQESWGDMAQYTNGDSEQQSTESPSTWGTSKKSDEESNADDDQRSDDDSTGLNPWTPAPSSEDSNKDTEVSVNSWTQAPSRKSGGEDNEDDESDTSPSSKGDDDSRTQVPSRDADNEDGDHTDSSSESSETSESSGESWKQEPIVSSGGSHATGGGASSTGAGDGGGSSTPSTGGGKVPDGSWPASTGTVQHSEAYIIKAGETFDGKMQTFERSDVTCEGQTESGADTAVFKMEPGATLKNAIIGKNQMEGVHCDKHDCTIDNVWWDDVCEDALSIKGGTASSVSTVTGGGARSADDKVIQHNGYGTVKIDGFYGEDISKLYRSCGTCGDRAKKVEVSNVYVVNPDNAIVTVNKNWGDEATLSNIWVKSSKSTVKICQWSQGNADGEPSMLGDGPSPPLCQYSESDVHINGDVSQAGGSTPSTGSTGTTPSEGSSTFPSSESSETDGGDTNGSTGAQPSGGNQASQTPSSSSGTVPDGTWPTSTGSVQFTEPHTIKAGEVFDGKMQMFERSDITCSDGEGQKDTAVFLVEAGGTLKNAIIGKNQKEGVHCDDHDCTIENVWWDDVCEDALSIKGGSASSVTTVTNCGARSASDKVVQHNGQGTVNIDGFYAEDFGKLYRSCGTCGDIPRTVTVKNVYAVNPQVSVITVNENYGDKATLSNIWVKTSDGSNEVKVCQWSQGGDDPTNLGDGPSPPLCQYSESDVHINQDVSQTGGSTPSTGLTGATSTDNGGAGNSWTQAPSQSKDDNKSDESKSDDSKSDENKPNDDKSGEGNSDSTKQETESDSVVQSEVAGEAGKGNSSGADAESAMKLSTTPKKKCNIRRKRN